MRLPLLMLLMKQQLSGAKLVYADASWAAFKLCHSAAQLTTLSTTTNKQAAAVLEDTTTMLLTEYHPILPKRARI